MSGNKSLAHLDFTNAVLAGTNLADTNLEWATLNCAELDKANLTNANLQHAALRQAQLLNADLTSADLRGANLTSAYLSDTIVTKAKVTGTELWRATYVPIGTPSEDHVAGIRGVDTLVVPQGRQDSLVRLRELFRKSGLRNLEREATFSIESNMARHDRRPGSALEDRRPGSALEDRRPVSALEKVNGYLRWFLFEFTTRWGRYPGRALGHILILGSLSALCYGVRIAISGHSRSTRRYGVFKVWPSERLDPCSPSKVGADAKAEIVSARMPGELGKAVAWGLYLSLLSAFHIGWRDLNIGTWISRVQHKEFVLRSRGWIRTLSGIQSFISVYLLAIWALTYFGRPFQ